MNFQVVYGKAPQRGGGSATAANVRYSFPVTTELDVLQDVVMRLERSGFAYMLTGRSH